MPIVKEVKGNLLDAKEHYIMHGVNCLGVMGAGVAKAIADKYPRVFSTYKQYVNEHVKTFDIHFGENHGQTIRQNHAIGTNHFCWLFQSETPDGKPRFIVNAFTQDNVGTHERQVDYSAVATCFARLNAEVKEVKQFIGEENWDGLDTVAIPEIGCGLAGGEWDVVEAIINNNTPDLKITVYRL